ncbi:MAG: hypothetical protein R6U19_03890 [Bacteroidales bacterium]
MKYILFCFLLLSTFLAKGGKNFLIKINKRECITCFFGQGALNQINNKGFDVTLVFPDKDKYIYKRFLSAYMPGLNSNIKTMLSDTLFNQLNNKNISEVYLFNKSNKPVFQCDFRHIWTFLDTSTIFKKVIRCKIPDSIQPTFCSIYAVNNKFVTFDPVQQEVYVIDKYGNPLSHFIPDSLQTKDILTIMDSDSSTYKLYCEYYDAFKQFGFAQPIFQKVVPDTSDLLIMLSVPYPVITDTGGIILYKLPLLARINYKSNYISFVKIPLEKVQENLSISPSGFVYFRDKKRFVFNTYSDGIEKKHNYFLVEAKANKDSITILKTMKYDLRKIFEADTIPKSIYPELHDKYLYFQYTNALYNIYDGKSITTPYTNNDYTVDMLNGRILYDYYLDDFIIAGNKAYFIYSDSTSKDFYARKNLKPPFNQYIEKLDIGKGENKSKLTFISTNSFIYLNSKNEIVQYNISLN